MTEVLDPPVSQETEPTQLATISSVLIPDSPIQANHVKAAGSGLGAPNKAKWEGRPKFTPETARAAKLKSVEKQRKAKEFAELVKRDVALNAQALALERADMLAKQIRRTCEELEAFVGTKDRAQLLTALSRLIDQERVLRGIPNPGSYRPSKPRTEQSSSDATPL